MALQELGIAGQRDAPLKRLLNQHRPVHAAIGLPLERVVAVKQAGQGMEIMERGRRQIVHGFHRQRKEGVRIKPLPITKTMKQPGEVLIDEAWLLVGLLDDQADEPRPARGNGGGSARTFDDVVDGNGVGGDGEGHLGFFHGMRVRVGFGSSVVRANSLQKRLQAVGAYPLLSKPFQCQLTCCQASSVVQSPTSSRPSGNPASTATRPRSSSALAVLRPCPARRGPA